MTLHADMENLATDLHTDGFTHRTKAIAETDPHQRKLHLNTAHNRQEAAKKIWQILDKYKEQQ